MSDFKSLNLSATILSALEKKGYTVPTPIQIQSIPHLLEGRDLLGIAQTGTGKTAAFALPILDNLSKSKNVPHPNSARALILTPTRELASQIVDNIKLYGQDLGLKYAVIFGGVGASNQIKIMQKGCDIIVATPGRLLDLMNQGHIKFSHLEIFVLDEADRMLDMGFINDVKKIIAKLPKKRQTLFFSATMPSDVALLANSILNDPVRVEITPQATTVEKIDQRINLVEKANKPLLLKSILEQEDAKSVLVFSKTKHGANRIVEFLEKQGIKVSAIHGNKSQSARERALDGFRQGSIKVLVATDIAARGIDIPAITHVINYDIPHDPESYVHRIGRTARAGREGVAISFCDNSERELLRAVEKVIKLTLPIDETHPFHNVKSSAHARSELDKKERPKSGYKTTKKPRQSGDRPASYFSENRRWKDGNDRNRSKPSFKRDGFSENKKSEFGEERRKSGSDFRENSERRFDNKRPRFSGEDRNQRSNDRPKFDRKFSDDRRSGTYSADDRRSKFTSDDNRERPARRDFADDRRGGQGFGGGERRARTDYKPAFGDRNNRFASSEKRSEGRSEFKSDRPSFSDRRSNDVGKKFGGHRSGGFGGNRFDNKNNGGTRKPSRPNKY